MDNNGKWERSRSEDVKRQSRWEMGKGGRFIYISWKKI